MQGAPHMGSATPTADVRQVKSAPKQKNLSGLSSKPFSIGHVKLLAEYDVTARVLGKKYYNDGKQASIAPLDLALGWQQMAEPAVYNRLNITNSNRWYNYRWSGAPPLVPSAIVKMSANTHIIPANAQVKKALKGVRKGDIVTLKGYLVHYREDVGNRWWEWKSSLTRSDSGDGACELMYVEHVLIY